jgi:plastocyanin
MTPTQGHRTDMLRRTILGVGAIAVLSLPSCGGDGDPPACEDPRATASVTMADFAYEPGCVEVAAGSELEIANEGQAPHTFTVDSDGPAAEIDVAAGEQGTLSLPELAVGTYRVICTYHPQMEAALRITG